jgi:hypothetical protein
MVDSTISIKISGYIDIQNLTTLSPTMTGSELKTKVFSLYDMVKNDIGYRVTLHEEDTYMNIDELYGNNSDTFAEYDVDYYEVPDDFVEFADNYINNHMDIVEIEEVSFDSYYEYGEMRGYDYVATINIKWANVVKAYKNK